MKNNEINKVLSKYSKNVHYWCDTEHAHSPLTNCLSPKTKGADERDVIICKLCTLILSDRDRIKELLSKITG